MVIGLEAFRKRKRATRDVEIDGLGEVRIGDMGAKKLLDLRTKHQRGNEDMTGEDAIAFYLDLAGECWLDEKGKQLFPDDPAPIGDLPFTVIQKLGEAILDHNGLGPSDPTKENTGDTSSG